MPAPSRFDRVLHGAEMILFGANLLYLIWMFLYSPALFAVLHFVLAYWWPAGLAVGWFGWRLHRYWAVYRGQS